MNILEEGPTSIIISYSLEEAKAIIAYGNLANYDKESYEFLKFLIDGAFDYFGYISPNKRTDLFYNKEAQLIKQYIKDIYS